MSGFSKFVVTGAGVIGASIISELAVQPNVTITVLTRKESTSKKTYPTNVSVVSVDYTNSAELQVALTGHEVVISTLNHGGFAAQLILAKAAKEAGVKHFVPSEYGIDTTALTHGYLFENKTKLHSVFDSLGIAYTLVFTGPWPDYCLVPSWGGVNFSTGVFKYPAPGAAPITWTLMNDVTRFIAHYFTHTTTPERIVRLEGDRKSFAEIAPIYEKSHPGVKVKVAITSLEETKEYLEKNPTDIVAELNTGWSNGLGFIGEPNGSQLWPEWKPASLEDVLASFP